MVDNDVLYGRGRIVPSIEYKKWLLEQSKKILKAKYPDGEHIDECSKEWVEKQVTTQGIVKYYSAYFSNPSFYSESDEYACKNGNCDI